MDVHEEVTVQACGRKEDNGTNRTLWKGEQEKNTGKGAQDTLDLILLSGMTQETSKPNESDHPMKNVRAAVSGDVFSYNSISSSRRAGLSSIKYL